MPRKKQTREQGKQYRANWRSRGLCTRCATFPLLPGLSICKRCQKGMNDLTKRQKEKVISHYGNYCSCCKESQIKFLTIDSMNEKHKNRCKYYGKNFYMWLEKQGYPSDFQVLCMNCNFAKGMYGGCPHNLD